ncbi:DUF5675 family protein, partial [Capnocytophaga felis]|uniref:DUF5675 family protein n=1 Tax=Capnocytophaga felis TaxID=2267611 RepID=UPI001565CD58
ETQTRSKGRVYEDKLAKSVTVDIRLCKERVNYDKAEWIYVKSHYYREGRTIYNQGWVEVPKEEERFSAYHWDKFGFKTYDAENHRMYPIKGVNSYSGTSGFIKEMLALLDKNKDNKIQNEELQACYNKPEPSHTFSRMVCKHKSEWSYKWAKIKSDYEKFIKYHYPDAKQAYVDERLKEIETKYKGLYDFWDKLKFETDTFWYFEPFAWVEQMNRVFDVLDKNTIYITRKWEKWTGENKTSSTFGIFKFGDLEGYICEPYGPETIERNKDKRIPEGTYNLMWHTSKNFPKSKYVKKGYPELKNGFPKLYNEKVPADRGILIHSGTTGKDSEGCLLPGTKIHKKKEEIISISGSITKFYEIIAIIEEKGIENIKIEIKDETQ